MDRQRWPWRWFGFSCRNTFETNILLCKYYCQHQREQEKIKYINWMRGQYTLNSFDWLIHSQFQFTGNQMIDYWMHERKREDWEYKLYVSPFLGESDRKYSINVFCILIPYNNHSSNNRHFELFWANIFYNFFSPLPLFQFFFV